MEPEQIKPLQLVGKIARFKFESKFKGPAGHQLITFKDDSRRQLNLKVLTAESLAELLGPLSGTAQACQTAKHKVATNRVSESSKTAAVAAGSNLNRLPLGKLLPLLQY